MATPSLCLQVIPDIQAGRLNPAHTLPIALLPIPLRQGLATDLPLTAAMREGTSLRWQASILRTLPPKDPLSPNLSPTLTDLPEIIEVPRRCV